MCAMTDLGVRGRRDIPVWMSRTYYVVRSRQSGSEFYITGERDIPEGDAMIPFRPLYRIRIRPRLDIAAPKS